MSKKGGSAPSKDGPKAKGKAASKAASGPEPSKPKIVPKTAMKPIWWNRLLFGGQIKKGETVWDEVNDDIELLPIEQLESRFSKNAVTPKEKPKKAESETKKEEVKLLRILTDPNVIVGKEASLKHLPPVQDVARALEELDDNALSTDLLRVVIENACPNPAQMKQLTEARKEQPHIPMALPEQYMWVIGNLAAYQQRLDCWIFARTYLERQEIYGASLASFESIVQSFVDSECLPSLLGLILATGNYLNGDTIRGQADGFDLEALGKLEGIKDPAGKDIRHFIFDVFFNALQDKASILIDELCPCFLNVTRRLAKDSDGTEKLSKQARVGVEDFEQVVNALHAEFQERHETMQMILQYFEDPADAFRLRMPEEFARAKARIDDLVAQKERAKDKYAKLLSWFQIKAMKSSEFCLLWDNLLVPSDLIVNKPEKVKKDVLIPSFCQNKAINIHDLMILWEFKDASDKKRVPGGFARKKGKGKGGIMARRGTVQAMKDANRQADLGAAGSTAPGSTTGEACPGCGNFYMDDSSYCRKCGQQRLGGVQASQAGDAGGEGTDGKAACKAAGGASAPTGLPTCPGTPVSAEGQVEPMVVHAGTGAKGTKGSKGLSTKGKKGPAAAADSPAAAAIAVDMPPAPAGTDIVGVAPAHLAEETSGLPESLPKGKGLVGKGKGKKSPTPSSPADAAAPATADDSGGGGSGGGQAVAAASWWRRR